MFRACSGFRVQSLGMVSGCFSGFGVLRFWGFRGFRVSWGSSFSGFRAWGPEAEALNPGTSRHCRCARCRDRTIDGELLLGQGRRMLHVKPCHSSSGGSRCGTRSTWASRSAPARCRLTPHRRGLGPAAAAISARFVRSHAGRACAAGGGVPAADDDHAIG